MILIYYIGKNLKHIFLVKHFFLKSFFKVKYIIKIGGSKNYIFFRKTYNSRF